MTEAHRLAQVQVAATTVRQLNAAWRIVDPANVDRTAAQWLEIAKAVVAGQHRVSGSLAADYMEVFRRLELGSSSWVPPSTPTLIVEAVETSLTVTGPIKLKEAMSGGMSLAQAFDLAQAASAGAASRHALSGGRGVIDEVLRTDPAVRGYARVTSGKPCAFCAMLASRGPVYESAASGSTAVRDGVAKKFHDGCACTTEPIYSDGSGWPPGAKDFSQLWETSTGDFYGHNKVKAFRRAYEASLQ